MSFTDASRLFIAIEAPEAFKGALETARDPFAISVPRERFALREVRG